MAQFDWLPYCSTRNLIGGPTGIRMISFELLDVLMTWKSNAKISNPVKYPMWKGVKREISNETMNGNLE